MQKARRHRSSLLRPLVSARFQVYFTPLLGVLFTFPSRYLFTIGLLGVFSLTGWSRQIQTGFHVPRPTQGSHYHIIPYLYRALTFSDYVSQRILVQYNTDVAGPTTPA